MKIVGKNPVEVVFYARDKQGRKILNQPRITIKTNQFDWLANRFEREVNRGIKGRERVAAAEELFAGSAS